jgi:REP element-mobilizing transposase RayT
MNRGLNHCNIFHNDEQHYIFYELLAEINKRYGVEVHAYCLMDNHYHLLLHTPNANLSCAMQYLDGLYTKRFNSQEKRDGPLFRGRYKAILIEAENYILQLSRYIHLNPVSAYLCKYPENFIWSSYRAYILQAKKQEWLYCEEVLSRCSENLCIKAYSSFVKDGIDEELAQVFSKNQWPNVLGSIEWSEKIKSIIHNKPKT